MGRELVAPNEPVEKLGIDAHLLVLLLRRLRRDPLRLGGTDARAATIGAVLMQHERGGIALRISLEGDPGVDGAVEEAPLPFGEHFQLRLPGGLDEQPLPVAGNVDDEFGPDLVVADIALEHGRIDGDRLAGSSADAKSQGRELARDAVDRRIFDVGQDNDGQLVIGIAVDRRPEAVDAAAMRLDAPVELPTDQPSEPVVMTMVGEHRVERRAVDHLAAGKSLVPEQEIVDGRIERARGERQAHRDKGRILPVAADRVIAGSSARHDRDIVVVAGVVHAERIEDVLLQIPRVALARDLLDDVAEQDVAAVVVDELRPRLEFERRLPRELDDLLGRALDL